MGNGSCCSAEKVFLYANVTLAMYAGAILATAVRLTYDPSTYGWFRLLCEQQYRVTTGHMFCAGAYLLLLIYLGASAVFPPAKRKLLAYSIGTVVLICSEVVYTVWLGLSLKGWWESSHQAELVRSGLALQEDVKKMLGILEKHHKMAEEVNNAVDEVARDAPKNAYVVVAALALSLILQILVLVLSWLLQRRAGSRDMTQFSGSEDEPKPYMYSAIAREAKRTSEEFRRAILPIDNRRDVT